MYKLFLALSILLAFVFSVIQAGIGSVATFSIYLFLLVIQGVALFFVGYQTLMSYLGLRKFKKTKLPKPVSRFAVLVAAHNEEEVIGQICENLKQLDYPKNLYDVFVICDNCSDKTADIVRNTGITAMERYDSAKIGKGYGLEWMFEQLWKLEERGVHYDAVTMFDADNLVNRDFLQIINAKLQEGHEVIQGYLDAKNPNDTWVTKSYAFAYWSTNRIYQLAREHLQLTAQLGGTGVTVSTKVLKEIGWGATSLTEDLEFTQRYILKTGKRVAWAHEAKLYDEKPLEFNQSFKQRIRWMQGHFDCMTHFALPLVKEGIKSKQFMLIDSAIYLMMPSRSILAAILLVFTLLSYGGIYQADGFLVIDRSFFLNTSVYIFFIAAYLSLPVLAMILENKGNKLHWIILSYVFGFTWIPVTILGLLKKNQRKWNHTKHTRSVSLNELESEEIKEKLRIRPNTINK